MNGGLDMNKYLISVFVLIFIFVAGFVQAGDIKVMVNENNVSNGEDYEMEHFFSDEDFEDFKINGGPTIGTVNLDFNKLNTILSDSGFGPLKEEIVVFGGGGIIGSNKNSRFGGFGGRGSVSSLKDGQEANFVLNYGGFIYEKGIISARSTDVSLGFLFGGGNIQLNLTYDRPLDFDLTSARTNNFTKNFFLLQPRLNLHQQISSFIGLDIEAGYMLSYDGENSWELNGYKVDGPLDDFQAPTLNVRLSFGF